MKIQKLDIQAFELHRIASNFRQKQMGRNTKSEWGLKGFKGIGKIKQNLQLGKGAETTGFRIRV